MYDSDYHNRIYHHFNTLTANHDPCWVRDELWKADYKTGISEKPAAERINYDDWLPKCNKPTAIQPISDRQQPVFLYLTNTMGWTIHCSPFTVYSPCIIMKLLIKNQRWTEWTVKPKKTFYPHAHHLTGHIQTIKNHKGEESTVHSSPTHHYLTTWYKMINNRGEQLNAKKLFYDTLVPVRFRVTDPNRKEALTLI